MNYFELFDLKLSFDIDKSALTKKYYQLSKMYHPDRFTLAEEEAQSEALTKSTEVNKAYKILKEEQSRIRYILELLGKAPEEGKETMPQDFLMEMMDINEAIMDYKMDPTPEAKASIEKSVSAFQSEIKSSATAAMNEIDLASPSDVHLNQIKEYYLKSKYLRRMLQNLEDRGVEM